MTAEKIIEQIKKDTDTEVDKIKKNAEEQAKIIISNAKNHHPVNIMIITAIHPAYFCLFPKTALKTWPPSNWPAGRRFKDVIKSPIQPAKKVRFKSITTLWLITDEKGTSNMRLDIAAVNKESPKNTWPDGISVT